jgi:hypothetical protein
VHQTTISILLFSRSKIDIVVTFCNLVTACFNVPLELIGAKPIFGDEQQVKKE